MSEAAELEKYRYKIIIEYLGAGYCGWQRQKNSLSIQQVLEDAIFAFSKERVSLVAAGRTDAGVHAYGQVAHFDFSKTIDPYRLTHSINHFCRGHTIGVVDAEMVSMDFDARFSAQKRHYVYKILNRRAINIINHGQVTWIKDRLDIEAMQRGANYLLGKHDFTSFRAKECQAKSPVKTMDLIEIRKSGDNIEIYFSALSFLHHMVRNIVGSLLMIGRGQYPASHMKTILEAKDRSAAGPTVDGGGLYFLKVDY